MELKKITIENFKGIKKPVSIELKPITLLFGPNNAGKSTILQALHFMREVFINKNFNPDITETGGNSVNLGGFQNIIHDHNIDSNITFGLDFNSTTSLLSDLTSGGIDIEDENLVLDKTKSSFKYCHKETIKTMGKINDISVEVSLRWNKKKQEVYIACYEIKVNKSLLFRLINLPNFEDHLRMLIFEHPILPSRLVSKLSEEKNLFRSQEESERYFHEVEEDHNNSYSLEDYYNEQNKEDKIQNEINKISKYYYDNFIDQLDLLKTTPLLLSKTGIHIQRSHFNSTLESNEKDLYYSLLSSIAKTTIGLLKNGIEPFYYIGPLREIPQRNNIPRSSTKRSRWASGLSAYDIISDSDDDLIENINAWLSKKEKFNSGYKILRKKFKLLDVESQLMDNLVNRNVWSDEYNQKISNNILALPEKTEIFLIKKNSNIRLFLQDVGTGISQILPIIVGVLKLKSQKSNHILGIEQPELHIHPAMQAEMGDLFIDQVTSVDESSPDGFKNSFSLIIETHSEHLLLRILRRIREVPNNNNCNSHLSNKDVGVYYIANQQNFTKAIHVAITEDGEFSRPWPNGFFPERAKELFS